MRDTSRMSSISRVYAVALRRIARHGFGRLVEAVVNGTAGAILAVEVSRLSRSSEDWRRLLGLCSVAGVVVIDEQAIYDPSDPDDKLLLDLKPGGEPRCRRPSEETLCGSSRSGPPPHAHLRMDRAARPESAPNLQDIEGVIGELEACVPDALQIEIMIE